MPPPPPTGDADEKTAVVQVQEAPPSRSANGSAPSLVVIYTKQPTLLGKRFVLEGAPLRVGRSASVEVQLADDDAVSRRHATFEAAGGAWRVLDHGSTNGTFVNDGRINQPRALVHGDRVQIGATIFKFLADDVEALYHEEIYRLTILDGLTQAHVKRYYMEALDKELVRARRHGRPLSVVMIDLDRFKNLNDTYGHLAGDAVLRQVAVILRARVRENEVVARFGGEEFALLLPDTDVEGARVLVEDVRARVAAGVFTFEEERLQVTVSCGIAAYIEGDDAMALIQRADGKLYEAKRSGRNKVMV